MEGLWYTWVRNNQELVNLWENSEGKLGTSLRPKINLPETSEMKSSLTEPRFGSGCVVILDPPGHIEVRGHR